MRVHPRKQRAFGAGMAIALGGLVASACSTSNVHEVYTSTDGSGLHQSKVFFPGDTVHCIAKLFTSRSDAPSIDWYLQPLEIAGKRVNLPPLHLDPTGPKTANKGDSLSILQFDPGALFYAAQYHPARSITAPNAQDDASAVALAQDLHDTFVDHMNDKAAHKNGLVDPTVGLMPANCSKVSNEYDPSNCALMINQMKELYNRHISDATFHVVPDAAHSVNGQDALTPPPPSQATAPGPPPPLPLVEVSLYPLLNEFKLRLTDHIFTLGGGGGSPQIPGHFRCGITFDGQTTSTDFAILPSGAKPPPADTPPPGGCDQDTVVFCPDPSPGADPNDPTTLVRCCTFGHSCGKGPAQTNICYPN